MEGVEIKLAFALGRLHLGAGRKKDEHLGRVVAEPTFPDLPPSGYREGRISTKATRAPTGGDERGYLKPSR